MDFNDILEMVVEKKASDLFITADIPPSIKVHGRVMPVSKTRLDASQSRELTLGLMTPEQRDEFLHTKECNFAFSAKNIGRFRVSAFVQRDCVGMVLRRIETRIPSFEELGLPPTLHELAMANRGIVFFVGATGTGKSTSLAAMVGYRNQNSTGHIISIEIRSSSCNHAGYESSPSVKSGLTPNLMKSRCVTHCVRRRTSFSSARSEPVKPWNTQSASPRRVTWS